MEKYNPQTIEPKWQEKWFSGNLYKTPDKSSKPKHYALVEFPYPSGEGLHIGHTFAMTGADVFARKKRMEGYNVLFPMGWDAFGLPTENYAIKTGIKPQAATAKNTANFKKQMQRLGFSFDWDREINTTDPNYYKWTQWIFTQLFKRGLAYKKKMPISFCPKCKIGLANEEVIKVKGQKSKVKSTDQESIVGESREAKSVAAPSYGASLENEEEYQSVCERCDTPVIKKELSQWIVRITDYADRLISNLDKTDFIEKVKLAQVNWVGRSEGARIRFRLAVNRSTRDDFIEVFTTRPDTLFGATFLVLAPEYWLVDQILSESHVGEVAAATDRGRDKASPLKNNIETQSDVAATLRVANSAAAASHAASSSSSEIKHYVEAARAKSELERTELTQEKTGVFSGLYAINPATGEQIPIWISDFVLSSYGTGAIMAVPAHDERDFAFARKYNLSIMPVIAPVAATLRVADSVADLPYTEYGVLINSGDFSGMKSEEAILKICAWLKEKGVGESSVSYHLRDWIFSRQHYWGEPIPMIYCEECARKGISWWETEEGKAFLNFQVPSSNFQISSNDKIFKQKEENHVCVSKDFGSEDSLKIRKLKIENSAQSAVGWFPVSDSDLPVKLPDVEKYQPTGTGESPLANVTDWVTTTCPHCGGKARRETDTMPNWAGSDWYFLAYCFASTLGNPNNQCSSSNNALRSQFLAGARSCQTINNNQAPNSRKENHNRSNSLENWNLEFGDSQNIFSDSKKILGYWLPVDVYIGGDEHNTLHLLYSRFIYQFLWDLGVVPKEHPEPYFKRISHGVILGPDGSRMSKSKGNVIIPDDVIASFGADVLRLYLMFLGPFDATMAWDNKGVEGCARFLNRVWKLTCGLVDSEECGGVDARYVEGGKSNVNTQVRSTANFSRNEPRNHSTPVDSTKRKLNRTIKKVSEDIDNFHYNTAIASMMEFVNKWSLEPKGLAVEDVSSFLKILAPFAPFITEELYNRVMCGGDGYDARFVEGDTFSIHLSTWPSYDPKMLEEEEATIVVQVNGKLRGNIIVPKERSNDQAEVEKLAKEVPTVIKQLEGKSVKKAVFVPGKLINFVVS